MSPGDPQPAPAEPRWPQQAPDDRWEQARDAALALFIRQRLAHIDATGCREERQLAAGIERILGEWDRNRDLARRADIDEFAARISALGWALRCLAEPAWRGTPGWDDAFDPLAVAPDVRPKGAW
ncbi:hypothetical protein ABZ016_24505 [Streptomyces sp. NPDC006372]|uniref:hypothetical protein n=1 Tax=Streptomyces sp. NPDC006372 TaxID=3155599 RepID=UPI00339DC850